MRPTADAIRQLLIDTGHGAASGDWKVYVGFFPGDPDSSICVYDTAGMLDGRLMIDGFQIEKPGVQIQLRGQAYPTVWEKTKDVALMLDAQIKTTVVVGPGESYTLHNISRRGDILPMGVEEEGDRRRHYFSINAILTIERL